MKEELMHYIWKTGLFNTANILTTDGQEIQIIKRGTHNHFDGPDFFQSRIRIGETEWFGNVEMHILASEWFDHKHHLDENYNNTILHVVMENNKIAIRKDGTKVPTLILKELILTKVLTQYKILFENSLELPCQNLLPKIDHFTFFMAQEKSLIERMKRKSDMVKGWQEIYQNHWQTVLYISILRSFGLKPNADIFEEIANQLPLNILAKHKKDEHQINALLFGLSGLLIEDLQDNYYNQLKREWLFLKQKYNLIEPQKCLLFFKNIRPANFPTIRLSQFANLISKSLSLFSQIIENQNVIDIKKLFEVKANQYWETHYNFDKISSKHDVTLSDETINRIIINGVLPVLFSYSIYSNNEKLKQKVFDILLELKPEKNKITDLFKKSELTCKNGFDSQAMIELFNEFCSKKRCLDCAIGHKILSMEV